jgi:Putative Ig domain
MNKVNGKRLIVAGFALIALAATMGLTSCASSSPITVTFTTPAGALPEAGVGHAYSTTVSADGSTGPPTGVYTYALNSGTLPHGLTLTSANTLGTNDTSVGLISGTDTTAADNGKTFTFTISATDSETPAHVGISGTYTITVN